MKVHELKILNDFADSVVAGDKTFEIRENDRGFQKGDFDKITFSREKNSPYIDMEFNYHNGCRYSSFKLEDMIKVIEILKEQK